MARQRVHRVEGNDGSFKKELIDRYAWDGIRDVRPALFDYIEAFYIDYIAAFYNRERLHSTLDYVSPAAFESAQPTGT